MPQLDISTFLPQVIWLLITFSALYLVMARVALPRVGEVLEERQNRLDSDLEQAEKFKADSEKLEAEYEQLTAKARAEAQGYLREQRERLGARLGEKQAEMSARTDAKLAAAEDHILKVKTAAMKDLEVIATEVCVALVGQLSGQKMTAASAKAAVKTEIGSGGN